MCYEVQWIWLITWWFMHAYRYPHLPKPPEQLAWLTQWRQVSLRSCEAAKNSLLFANGSVSLVGSKNFCDKKQRQKIFKLNLQLVGVWFWMLNSSCLNSNKKVVKCCFHMYFLMSSEILVNFDHYLVEYAFPYLQNRSKVGKLQWRFCLWFGWPSSTIWSGSVGSKNQGM